MEVHAHSHHGKKKWTEYFWEFFMLFLAVTLGFFVENQREHYTEGKRGKQYIRSLIEDLKIDSAKLYFVSSEFKKISAAVDTLLYDFDDFGKNDPLQFKRQYDLLHGFPDFIYTDRTIQQLKSSGGLRLIHGAASDSIINYDSQVQDLLLELTSLGRAYETQGQLLNQHVNMKALRDALADQGAAKNKKVNFFLLTDDKNVLAYIYNTVLGYKEYLFGISQQMDGLKHMAIELISFLEKDYQLK